MGLEKFNFANIIQAAILANSPCIKPPIYPARQIFACLRHAKVQSL
jgi:hypothetical protein